MPRPAAYTPRPSTGSSPRSPAPSGAFPAPRSNGAATASFVLLALALAGGIVTFWWLDGAYPRLAGVARVAIALVVLAALALAVGAMAVATRRSTSLAPAVIALVCSALLVVGLIAWFVLRLPALGLLS